MVVTRGQTQAGWSDAITLAAASSKVSGTALKWHRTSGIGLEFLEKWADELLVKFHEAQRGVKEAMVNTPTKLLLVNIKKVAERKSLLAS